MKHVSLHVTKPDYDKLEEEAFNKTYTMMPHMKYVLSQIDKQAQGDI